MHTNNDGFSDFKALDKNSEELFRKYRYRNVFADTSFSMLYSWHERFGYEYKLYDDVLAVTGIDIDGERIFFLIKKHDNDSFVNAITSICRLCRDENTDIIFEYISEDDLSDYRKAAELLGMSVSFSYDAKYSDYIYETSEFISLQGSSFKTKRGGYNALMRTCPEIKAVPYNEGLLDTCLGIFDEWCGVHECGNCYYGCEKKAFLNFMEIYDPDYHRIFLSFNEDTPMSFIVHEQINSDTMCYTFQKNAVRQRGLTYWLNRETAQKHTDVRYINLEEDMGIPGIAEDKNSLRPCRKLNKYTAVFK